MSALFKVESICDGVNKKCTTITTWNNLNFTSLTNSKTVFHPRPDKSTSWLLEVAVQQISHSASQTVHCRKLKICLSHLSGVTEIGSGTLTLLGNTNSSNIYRTENLNFDNVSGKLCESEANYKYNPTLGYQHNAAYSGIQAIEIREACLKIVCNITFTNYAYNHSKPKSVGDNLAIEEYWKTLYTSKVLTDVKFAVEDIVLEGHRAVLSNRSDVFARMFQQDMLERNDNDPIEIEDCSAVVFDSFLKYLYVNEVDDSKSKDWKLVLPLLQVADKYNVKSLIDICSDILIKSFSIWNVLTILQVADLHQVKKLKETAKAFVNRNFNTIGASAEWSQMIVSHPCIVTDFFVYLTSSKR